SGAGAQSRAADTHLILRPHQETDAVVLEAVTRSWQPVEPICLRWQYPVWTPDSSLDPSLLRPDKPRRPKEQRDKDNEENQVHWTAEKLAEEFVSDKPKHKDEIQETAERAGLSSRKFATLL